MAAGNEAPHLVNWLIERSGAPSVKEFARRTDLRERDIHRWRAGEAAPSFGPMVKMLQVAGVLDESAPVAPHVYPEIEVALTEINSRLEERLSSLLSLNVRAADLDECSVAQPAAADELLRRMADGASAARALLALLRPAVEAATQGEPARRASGRKRRA